MRFGETPQFYAPFSAHQLQDMLATAAFLSTAELDALRRFCVHLTTLRGRFQGGRLARLFADLDEHRSLKDAIDACIDESRQVRDTASPALRHIRQRLRAVQRQIDETLRRMLAAQPDFFSDSSIVERNGRKVLLVRANFKRSLPGVVHAYSNSGETVFVEPLETTELGAELVELSDQEREEIERILRELTDRVRVEGDALAADLERVAGLDLLFAKAAYARAAGCNVPVFGPELRLRNGFHPVLKQLRGAVVPLDLELDPDQRVLLISGPNAGGKTVVLKTIGLIALMARCGMCIPAAEGSVTPFFDDVFADIGDEQSLEYELSTFAGHLNRIKDALQGSGGCNLVLLDELMNQTSVEEGSALAQAILEDLADSGSLVIATTHNEALKIYVSRRSGMVNAGMEFADKPTYRLIMGIPQPSNAVKLAAQMGVKRAVIERAESLLDKERVSLNELLEQLGRELQGASAERLRLEQARREYEQHSAEMKEAQRRARDALQEKYRKELIESKRTVDRLIRSLKKGPVKKEVKDEATAFFAAKLQEETAGEPYYPRVGETVFVRGMTKPGKVLAERTGRYKIGLDKMFLWVGPSEIKPLSAEGNGK